MRSNQSIRAAGSTLVKSSRPGRPEAARADEEVAQTGGSPTTLESLEQEAEMSQRPSKMLLYGAFTGQRTKEVDRG
ncbi:unnamed protein product [Symbiodinium pilosum]|uniref:Uncharacterized protein n=1 Tax=Symbiodinium pilosum TaxID=2952 RepID=A0A812S2H6_SYMPI|nr:unnamed protein product [Symbiodinium pilosum]